MALKYSVKNLRKMPWFMAFDDIPFLLTSSTVPEQVRSSKPITYAEIQIPGGSSGIPKFGSAQSRRISFQLRIAEFNDKFTGGITDKIKLLEIIRNPQPSKISDALLGRAAEPFTRNPKCLYWYGTGDTVPLWYYVARCDWVTSYPNRYGMPQVAEVDFDLILDESHALYQAERAARYVLGSVGAIKGLRDIFGSGNAYKNRKNTALF